MTTAVPGTLRVSNDCLADLAGYAAMECYGVVGMAEIVDNRRHVNALLNNNVKVNLNSLRSWGHINTLTKSVCWKKTSNTCCLINLCHANNAITTARSSIEATISARIIQTCSQAGDSAPMTSKRSSPR